MTLKLSSNAKPITRCRKEQTSLLEYSNENRKKGNFCDVTLQSGDVRLPAHKLVLSCYCQYFKNKFNSPANKECQETIHIDVDGKSLKILLEYIYTGTISIDSENVIGLLQAANYLWLKEVKEFCFEYLKSIISPRNCAEIYIVAEFYSNDSLKQDVYKLVKENYKEVSESEGFINLPYEQLFTCLFKNIHLIDDELLCTSIIKWVKHDESNRKERLTILIRLIHFENISSIFLQTIIAEKFVQENEESMKLINQRLSSLPNDTEIISISGDYTEKKVITVWPLDSKSHLKYPDLPVRKGLHHICSVKWKESIYCVVVGRSILGHGMDELWRLDLNETDSKWQCIASVQVKRLDIGYAIFSNHLVVAGGFNGVRKSALTQTYNFQSQQWRELASLKQGRHSHKLVVCAGCLYAVGGHDGFMALSSVERLRELNGKWEDAPSMQTPRCHFAAVVCDDVIYVIGGWNTERETVKSVEKFDPAADERWAYVSDMNIERHGHSACVFNEKIFVVGGMNKRNEKVKKIECYDPEDDGWELVGEIQDELVYHSLVAL